MMVNFHVPLPNNLNEELRVEAKRSGQPATELARNAIQLLLEQRRKDVLHREIAAYAETMAGTSQDLDTQLEAASVEQLLESEG